MTERTLVERLREPRLGIHENGEEEMKTWQQLWEQCQEAAEALARAQERCAELEKALKALTIWSRNGEQLCFRSANGVPMGMTKRLEKIARAALKSRA